MAPKLGFAVALRVPRVRSGAVHTPLPPIRHTDAACGRRLGVSVASALTETDPGVLTKS